MITEASPDRGHGMVRMTWIKAVYKMAATQVYRSLAANKVLVLLPVLVLVPVSALLLFWRFSS